MGVWITDGFCCVKDTMHAPFVNSELNLLGFILLVFDFSDPAFSFITLTLALDYRKHLK